MLVSVKHSRCTLSVSWLMYSKAIYALDLSNSTSTEFYRVNHVIDGMTLHNGKLYWTDSLTGSISSLEINAASRKHKVLKTGLDKPRAIVVTNRCASYYARIFNILLHNTRKLKQFRQRVLCSLYNINSFICIGPLGFLSHNTQSDRTELR